MALTAPPYTLDDLRARRSEIEAVASKYGATNVRVFGSAATGTVEPGSDVDLLVDFGPDGDRTNVFAISALLEDALGCRVDVLTTFEDRTVYQDASAVAMAELIEREAVPL